MSNCKYTCVKQVLRITVGAWPWLLTGIIFYPVAARINEHFIKKPISYTDIPAVLLAWVEKQGINRERFASHVDSINRSTAERELRGEYDHLIHFLLQSERFTNQPKTEPALSAYEFANGLSEAERSKYLTEGSSFLPPVEKIPRLVKARVNDFASAVSKRSEDERMTYFRELLNKSIGSSVSIHQHLYVEYARSMRFLYRKEFASRTVRRDELATYLASLYQTRGHSTDTQIEANFAVYVALASLKAQSPGTQLNRVLIVGPGLDFAPRTDLIDLFGPQSYQPFAIADALLGLKLADASRLQIHCVDINERVIAYLRGLREKKEVTLSILSGLSDSATHPLTTEFKEYFRDLGKSIGTEADVKVPPRFATHLNKSLKIRSEIIERINVDFLNIITERYDPSPNFDLVIVTNVFPYFNSTELLFALTNIAAMMNEGGSLIHNELQTVPSSFVIPLGLPLQQARTVLIASGKNLPLFDGIAIHRKEKQRSASNTQQSALRN